MLMIAPSAMPCLRQATANAQLAGSFLSAPLLSAAVTLIRIPSFASLTLLTCGKYFLTRASALFFGCFISFGFGWFNYSSANERSPQRPSPLNPRKVGHTPPCSLD